MSKFEFSYSLSVILLAVIVWVAAGYLCFENWRRRRGTKWVAALEGMRFLIMTLIGFTLLKPEYVKRIVRNEKPEIVVLLDSSESMETKDVVLPDKKVITRRQWVEQQLTNKFYSRWENNNKVIIQDFSNYQRKTNTSNYFSAGTDINSPLENLLKQFDNLRAVLLLSDGDWNIGVPPTAAAMKYVSREVPIYTVGVGSKEPLPDIIVEPVKAQSYALLGEQLAIPIKVRSYLNEEVKTYVQIYDNNVPEIKKEITIPPGGEAQQTVLWQPKTVGDHILRVEVPVADGEYLKDNNFQQFHITIRTEQLKVLVIETLPRWEYRYLRNALQRDPGVEVSCLLLHPQIGVGGGSNYISAFPESKEEISKYDVVFLGDIGIKDGELTTAQANLIKGLVEQQGSGLVFLPGIRGRQLSLVNSPLGELLPVVYDESKPNGYGLSTESFLQLTSTGRGHFLTMLTSDPEKNEELWKTLPGFYWSAGVLKSRPGSDVLGVHSGLRNENGRLPLLVTRPFGNGEVLFMGTDSAWRWRRGVEDRYHYRFWGQVVRWMAHKRHLAAGQGMRLVYSPENPVAGDTLFVYATIMDERGMPVEKGVARLTITYASGKVEHYDLNPVPGGWGVFTGNIRITEPGTHKVQLLTDKSKSRFETQIMVSAEKVEKLGRPINSTILKEIADLTNGKFVSVNEFNSVIDSISVLPEPKPMEIRIRLWANPYWAGLIIFLLAVYWTGRKLAGMI
ncbi:MAG TPA: hypothetical protein PLW02_00125 [Verrucomicrobiota bacterium]|nr:hypothetical protein [Verrucomicrobiota bacterium]